MMVLNRFIWGLGNILKKGTSFEPIQEMFESIQY
jgi:hypothetical protein